LTTSTQQPYGSQPAGRCQLVIERRIVANRVLPGGIQNLAVELAFVILDGTLVLIDRIRAATVRLVPTGA
jgi:hypothetical protein